MFFQYYLMSRLPFIESPAEISAVVLESTLQIELPYQEGDGQKPLWQELTAHHFPYLKGIRNVNFVYEAITHKDNQEAISALFIVQQGGFNKEIILDKKIHENVQGYLQEKGYDTYADSAAYYIEKNYSASCVKP